MQHPFFAGKTYRLRSVNLLFVMTKPIGWKNKNTHIYFINYFFCNFALI